MNNARRHMTPAVASYAAQIGASPLDLVLAGFGCYNCRPEPVVSHSRTDEQIAASLPLSARWNSKGYLVTR